MTALTWVDEPLALAIHEQLLVRHGGPSGVRDATLLQSAMARPQQLEAYGATPTLSRWPRPAPPAFRTTIHLSTATSVAHFWPASCSSNGMARGLRPAKTPLSKPC
jgi:hypothetical protein